jgi:hypothetical protein
MLGLVGDQAEEVSDRGHFRGRVLPLRYDFDGRRLVAERKDVGETFHILEHAGCKSHREKVGWARKHVALPSGGVELDHGRLRRGGGDAWPDDSGLDLVGGWRLAHLLKAGAPDRSQEGPNGPTAL